MAETRKLAAILVSDVVGYSRLAGSDEDRTLARLRALRSDLIDPIIAVHSGRVVKRTGDGAIVEFRSVVDAVRCAIEVQNGMVERNAGLPPERRIEFRIGIHLGDVVEESDGDLMGDGVNIAARLQGIAKPGAICLSEDAYRQVKARLDLPVSDLGAIQLKNIADPVRVFSLEVGGSATTKPTKHVAAKQRSIFVWAGAGIVALAVILGGAWFFLGPHRTASVAPNVPTVAKAGHLSIVVLPFRNLSGDPSQDYFADGITENLTTDLSRIRNSFVIARNTAFTFKGKNIDTKEISKELGVRYVLEGSVQRDQNHVRVNAQLIDGETGAHLWADRFEESITDLFKLQDQVVARLANALGYELVKAEAQRSTHSTNPDAIDLTMRGWAALWQQPTKESTASARDYFERAMKIDPQIAEAMVGFAYARLRTSVYGRSTPAEDTYAAQLDLLTKATAINPGYAFAYYVKSLALILHKAVSGSDRGCPDGGRSRSQCGIRVLRDGHGGRLAGTLRTIDCTYQTGVRPKPARSRWAASGTRSWAFPRFASVGLTRRLGNLSEQLTQGIGPFVPTPFWRELRPQRGTTPRRNSLWRRRVASILNSRSNCLRSDQTADDYLDGLRKAGLPEE